MPYIGEIRMLGCNFAPVGWQLCNGQLMPISENDAFYNLIGTRYGGDGQTTFGLPNLQSRVPIHMGQGPGLTNRVIGTDGGVETVTLTANQIPNHTHAALAATGAGNQASPQNGIWAASALNQYSTNTPGQAMRAGALTSVGGSQPHDNMMPSLPINFVISEFGIYPSESSSGGAEAPYLGEIRIAAFDFAPSGWLQCNGQLLPINQNQALFSLLGNAYGGDGRVTFALPDLRGRAPIHVGNGNPQVGQQRGQEAHTLTVAEMPAHNHFAQGTSTTANATNPSGNIWGTQTANPYSNGSPDVQLALASVQGFGGSQPHNNMQPYLTVNFIIATQGIFPSRN